MKTPCLLRKIGSTPALTAQSTGFHLDLRVDGSPASCFVALGRDKASELDVSLAGTPGFQNEGDNEPTGFHVSTGSTSAAGLPGTFANLDDPRSFFTQQHGLNMLWEIVRKKGK